MSRYYIVQSNDDCQTAVRPCQNIQCTSQSTADWTPPYSVWWWFTTITGMDCILKHQDS